MMRRGSHQTTISDLNAIKNSQTNHINKKCWVECQNQILVGLQVRLSGIEKYYIIWETKMFRVLKNTETLAIVKMWGTDTSGIVTLATDLLSPTMVIQGTPTVNITYLNWSVSSDDGAVINIKRNGSTVIGLYQNSGEMDMSANNGFTEDTDNTHNFEYQIVGTGYCYMTVRKASGYASKIESAQFSVYDNPTVVGS
jgi:hypothetical protein